MEEAHHGHFSGHADLPESGITAPLTVPLKVLYPLQRSDGSFIIQGLWLWQS